MTYLFRIDSAKDNDEFFATLRTSATHVYAGVDLHIGVGWVPDLVKVVVEESPDRCSLTLIELEATESAALISCRKYLPEKSADILSVFSDYLGRVIRQCRSTADSREHEFARLKVVLAESTQIIVTTAGALRSSAHSLEELHLIDQPKVAGRPRPIQHDQPESNRTFQGVIRLTRREAEALARCVMILDAVMRGHDRSGPRFECWRRRATSQPLKRFLTQNDVVHPSLRSLIFESKHGGITLDFEQVLLDLIAMWTAARKEQVDPD
jgi:hypothetical protein